MIPKDPRPGCMVRLSLTVYRSIAEHVPIVSRTSYFSASVGVAMLAVRSLLFSRG